MIHALRQIALLTAKDLRIEARTRQTLGLVVILGILIVTVLGLGLSAVDNPQARAYGAPAVLWVAYLFAGVLCFEKTMALERQDGALAGLLLAPIDRGLIFAGKLLSNLLLMFAVAAVITPVGILFFGFDLSAAPLGFAVVMGISMIGLAAVGTLFSALLSSTRLAGGLVAMAVFPIVLPLVIASTQLLTALFRDVHPQPLTLSALAMPLAFDAIFLVASWLMFELVLEP